MPEDGRSAISVFRGYLTLAVTAITFLGMELAIWVGLRPALALRPGSRDQILTSFIQKAASIALGIPRNVGGAHFGPYAPIPGESGVLMVMNHQSLLDIPLLVKTLTKSYPKIITRRRYGKGIPAVSTMLHLYEHPLVEPGREAKEQLAMLERVAREAVHPLAIYPEGTRTRDGQIGRFRRAGLRALLETRPWRVYVLVADGMWRCARLSDFVHKIGQVRVEMSAEGPFEFGPGDDTEAFIDRLEQQMAEQLSVLRGDTEVVEMRADEAS